MAIRIVKMWGNMFVHLLREGFVLRVHETIGLKLDSTKEEIHLPLIALLTQSPRPQNAFDPLLMACGMFAENWRQKPNGILQEQIAKMLSLTSKVFCSLNKGRFDYFTRIKGKM